MKIIVSLIVLITSFVSVFAAYDEKDIIPWWNSIINTNETWTWVIDGIFRIIVDYTFWLLALIVISVFLYIGYLFITSSWSEEKFKKAWKMFMYAIIWLAVTSLAWWIVKLVTTIWL